MKAVYSEVPYIFTDSFTAATIGRVQEIRPDRIVLDWDSLQDVSGNVTLQTDAEGVPVWTPAGIPEHETKFLQTEKLADRQYSWEIELDFDFLPDQTDEAPVQAGDWLLFSFYERGTGAVLSGLEMKVLRLQLPMSGKMYETDYYSVAGAAALTDFWDSHFLCDPEIRTLMRENGGAIFEDSIEASFGTAAWTPNLLTEFQQRRGYELTKYLPLAASISMMGMGTRYVSNPGRSVRVIEDYHLTLNDLYLDGHIKTLQNWAHSFGYQYRAQSYGCGVDTSSAAVVVDIPEGESLGFGANYDYFRNISGGVHILGRKLLSEEALADIFKAYALTWANAEYTLNQNFAAGVNRMIFHGASYEREVSGKYSQWPGWHAFQFAFADSWGERMPYWNDVPILTDYLSRTQAVLQGGRAQIDLAVFKVSKEYGKGFPELLDYGYSYDIISPYAVAQKEFRLESGVLCPEGPGYHAVIIHEKNSMDVPSIKKLLDMTQKGLPVFIVSSQPSRVHGLSAELAGKDSLVSDCTLTNLWATLLTCPTVYTVSNPKQLPELLVRSGIVPRVQYTQPGLRTTGRMDDDHSQWYFLFNSNRTAICTNVWCSHGDSWYLCSPWTGAVEQLDVQNHTVTISLEPGQCVFLTDAAQQANGQVQLIPGKKKIPLSSPWNLTLESWGPDPAASYPTDSRKEVIRLRLPELTAWDRLHVTPSELEQLGVSAMREVSGRGIYQSSFEWDGPKEAILRICSGADMVTEVYVNDVLQLPIEPSVNAGWVYGLKSGENTIKITIATTLQHRAAVENPWLKPGQSLQPDMGEMPEGEPGDRPFPPPRMDPDDPDAVFQGDPPPESEVFSEKDTYGICAVTLEY